MSARVTVKTETVARCVARQDGAYMIVTRKGNAGSSPTEIPEGTAVVIRDGHAVRAVR